MPRFRKMVLAPGVYTTRNGPVSFSAKDIRGFYDTGTAMLKAGLAAPCPLEHQSSAKPRTAEEKMAARVAFNTGWVSGWELNDKGVLYANVDIESIPVGDKLLRDPKDVTHFVEKNVRFVSPELLPLFRDGRGNEWKNCISHLALTCQPVWAAQEPFGGGTVALSLASGPAQSWADSEGSLRLSLADVWCVPKGCADGIPWGELDDEATVDLAAMHAPRGGVTLVRENPDTGAKESFHFRGGKFVPQSVVNATRAHAAANPDSPEAKDLAKLDAFATEKKKRLREAAGKPQGHDLAESVRGHDYGLTSREMANARRTWGNLLDHHGNLALHRMKQLVEKDLAELPGASGAKEDILRRRLSAYNHMLGWARGDGRFAPLFAAAKTTPAAPDKARPPAAPDPQRKAPGKGIERQHHGFREPMKAAPWEGGLVDHRQNYTAPLDSLHADPARFQFKQNVDKSGVTDELKGISHFNPDFAGVVSVWQDPADGKTYIVNGHHRYELAGRTGHPALAVHYIEAKSAKEARAQGALINIAEGRGTSLDAAKFMRDTGLGLTDMAKAGVSVKGKLAADAAVLTKLSDSAFNGLARGTLDEGTAIAVAKHLHDHDLQDHLFRRLQKRAEEGGAPPSGRVIEEMARSYAMTPKGSKGEGGGLFGDEEEPLIEERAEVAAHVRGELSKQVNDFLAVASKRRAERVAGAGNVLDTEANKQIAEESARVKGVFDTLANSKGAIADALNQGAKDYAGAKTRKEQSAAKQRALDAVRDGVFREAGIGSAVAGGKGGGAEGAEAKPGGDPVGAAEGADDAGGGETEEAGVGAPAEVPPAAEASEPAGGIEQQLIDAMPDGEPAPGAEPAPEEPATPAPDSAPPPSGTYTATYTATDIARMVDVSPATIRAWQKKGLLPAGKVPKDALDTSFEELEAKKTTAEETFRQKKDEYDAGLPSPESVPANETRQGKDGREWGHAKKATQDDKGRWGEVSPVDGIFRVAGQWMPIHGLSVGQEKPAAAGKGAGSPPPKPNEDGKGGRKPQSRGPMTPEEIEEERQRREDERQSDEIRSSPLGKMLAMAQKGPIHSLRRTSPGWRDWKRYAEEVGETGLQALAAKLEPGLDSEDIAHEMSHPQGFGESGGKGHHKKHPSSARAYAVVSVALDKARANGVQGIHAVAKALAEAQGKGGDVAAAELAPAVTAALAAGKPVPPEVLADYPDLAGGSATPVPPTTASLAADLKALHASAPETQTGEGNRGARFGDRKVFIGHLWDQWSKAHPGVTRDEFNKVLVDANRQGLVNLSRADLVEAMHPDDVRESELNIGSDLNVMPYGAKPRNAAATFHFVSSKEESLPPFVASGPEPPAANSPAAQRARELKTHEALAGAVPTTEQEAYVREQLDHKYGVGMRPVAGKHFPVKGELDALGGRWDRKNNVYVVPEDKKAEANAIIKRGVVGTPVPMAKPVATPAPIAPPPPIVAPQSSRGMPSRADYDNARKVFEAANPGGDFGKRLVDLQGKAESDRDRERMTKMLEHHAAAVGGALPAPVASGPSPAAPPLPSEESRQQFLARKQREAQERKDREQRAVEEVLKEHPSEPTPKAEAETPKEPEPVAAETPPESPGGIEQEMVAHMPDASRSATLAKPFHEMSPAEVQQAIDAAPTNAFATTTTEDWGNLRGQGKRSGHMVLGGMRDSSLQGKKGYLNPVGKLPEEEQSDVGMLEGKGLVTYLKARAAGLTHNASLDYGLEAMGLLPKGKAHSQLLADAKAAERPSVPESAAAPKEPEPVEPPHPTFTGEVTADDGTPQSFVDGKPATPEEVAAVEEAETPRETVARNAEGEKESSEYAFARDSSIPNAGEDLAGSARHVRNQWKGLEDAEKNGTADEQVTRENLFKNEPHNLAATAESGNALTALAMHLALQKYPAKPIIDPQARFSGEQDKEMLKTARKWYYDGYKHAKEVAERLARTQPDPKKALEEFHQAMRQRVQNIRNGGGDFKLPGDDKSGPELGAARGFRYMANNAYVRFVNSNASHPRVAGKNGTINQVGDFAQRVAAAYKDAPAEEKAEKVKGHALDIMDGDSFNKTFGTVKGGKKGFDPAEAYVTHAERVGGPSLHLPDAKKAVQHLTGKAGMRGIQWGNSVTDDERQHHAKMSAEAFADLTDILGLPQEVASLSGKLGLAIGARGKGNALAHYEPDVKDAAGKWKYRGGPVINLTRKNGVGSLAHEWGHFFDHMLAGGKLTSDDDKIVADFYSQHAAPEVFEYDDKGGIKRDSAGKPVRKDRSKEPMWQAYQSWREAVKSSGFRTRLGQEITRHRREMGMSDAKAQYWRSDEEVFARTFERYVQKKLEAADRKNTYLAGVKEHPLWPTNDEVAAMTPAFDAIFDAFRKDKSIVMSFVQAARGIRVRSGGARPQQPEHRGAWKSRRPIALSLGGAASWIPYNGPHGGRGWRHTGTGRILYQVERPGEHDEGHATNREALAAVGIVFKPRSEQAAALDRGEADELLTTPNGEAVAESRNALPDAAAVQQSRKKQLGGPTWWRWLFGGTGYEGDNPSFRVRVDGKDFFLKGEEHEFARSSALHEELGSDLARIAGVHAPETRSLEIHGKPHSLSEWTEGKSLAQSPNLAEVVPSLPRGQVVRQILFSAVAGLADRHQGNYMIDSRGNVVSVDHGPILTQLKLPWVLHKDGRTGHVLIDNLPRNTPIPREAIDQMAAAGQRMATYLRSRRADYAAVDGDKKFAAALRDLEERTAMLAELGRRQGVTLRDVANKFGRRLSFQMSLGGAWKSRRPVPAC